MTFPFTGIVILVVGGVFFLFRPKLLYPATIVFVPFTGTAVVNLEWANTVGGWGRSLEPWQFFFVLWVFREALAETPPWHRYGWFLTRRFRYGLFAFLCAVILSLSVPLVLSGTIWVPKPTALTREMIPLRLSSFDLSQTVYIAFGLFFAMFIAIKNSSPSKLFYTLRLYIASCTFAAGWGLFEFWCDLTRHAYPSKVFNTSSNISATGYKEMLLVGNLGRIGRISSVAQEPSVLAEMLLIAFVALVVCLGLRQQILQRKWALSACILISITLLAGTSSTAYFGMPMALIVAVVLLFRAGRSIKPYVLLIGFALATGLLILHAVPLVGSIFKVAVLQKYQTSSGVTRLHSVVLAAGEFLKSPLLGMGWHNVASWDLLFLILANTGIIGLLAFGSFTVPVFWRLWRSARRGTTTAVVFLSMFVLTILLAEGAGLTYAAGYVWLVFGLAAGASRSSRKELLPSYREIPSGSWTLGNPTSANGPQVLNPSSGWIA